LKTLSSCPKIISGFVPGCLRTLRLPPNAPKPIRLQRNGEFHSYQHEIQPCCLLYLDPGKHFLYLPCRLRFVSLTSSSQQFALSLISIYYTYKVPSLTSNSCKSHYDRTPHQAAYVHQQRRIFLGCCDNIHDVAANARLY
jgi:hypothetical protein